MKQKCLQYLKLNKHWLNKNPEKVFLMSNIFDHFKNDWNDIADILDCLDIIFKEIDLDSFVNDIISKYPQTQSQLYDMRPEFKNSSIHFIDDVLNRAPYDIYMDFNREEVDLDDIFEDESLDGTVDKLWAYLDFADTLTLILCADIKGWDTLYFEIKKDTSIFQNILKNMVYVPGYGLFFNQDEIENLIINWGRSL